MLGSWIGGLDFFFKYLRYMLKPPCQISDKSETSLNYGWLWVIYKLYLCSWPTQKFENHSFVFCFVLFFVISSQWLHCLTKVYKFSFKGTFWAFSSQIALVWAEEYCASWFKPVDIIYTVLQLLFHFSYMPNRLKFPNEPPDFFHETANKQFCYFICGLSRQF